MSYPIANDIDVDVACEDSDDEKVRLLTFVTLLTDLGITSIGRCLTRVTVAERKSTWMTYELMERLVTPNDRIPAPTNG